MNTRHGATSDATEVFSHKLVDRSWDLISLMPDCFCPFSLEVNKNKHYKAGYTQTKTYLVGSHCLVADLPVNGAFHDARHQLGNVFVIFVFAWNFLNCK